ncbi:MAG: FG-GAP repeat protein [Alphaproteobacteria bacterium]|nr:FG-GAP repeat protein [Alphaproteobacteria bacterium]MCB9696585.1 FG-GAP repeat protein [Alphaproteobacteria bacterium]
MSSWAPHARPGSSSAADLLLGVVGDRLRPARAPPPGHAHRGRRHRHLAGSHLGSARGAGRLRHAIELGDVDGDGDDDLLIGAPHADGEVPYGKAYLTLGPWTP